MKRRMIGIAFGIIFVLQIVFVPVHAENAGSVQAPAVDGYTLVDQNNKHALYADGKTGFVTLYDKGKNTFWSTNPEFSQDGSITPGQQKLMSAQLTILYYDKANTEQERNSQIACVAKQGLSSDTSSKTASFTYKFPDDSITICVEYSLKDGYLNMQIPIDKIEEGNGNKLTEISVLPYFGSGSYTDEGYLFIPDGSGSIIEMNNGKSAGAAVKERIYGDDVVVCDDRDTEIEKNMAFPVIGINKNDSGVLAVVTEGDAESYVNAYTSGMKKIYNCAYFSFEYRSTGVVVLDSSSKNAKTVKKIADNTISCKNYTVRYYPLENSGTYVDMANCYRNYLIKEKDFKKSDSASEDLPFYVTSYGAIQKQGTIFYIPATVTVPLTTYQQAGKMMKKLSDSGIKNIVFSYDGWTQNGLTGSLPAYGKYESKLGGKKQFLNLIETAKELSVTFLPNVNITDLYKSSSGYKKSSTAAATIDGTPGLQYNYNLYSRLKDKTLTPFYLVAPARYQSILEKFLSEYRLDISGMSMKKAGNILYSDHRKNNCDRLQSIGYAEDTFSMAKSKGFSLLTDSANAYAALYSDYISGAYTDDSHYDIENCSVPFYQILMYGYKSLSIESVNLSGSSKKSFLKAVETGSALSYTFNAQNFSKTENTYLANIYNSDYRDWTRLAAEQYSELNEIHSQIKGSSIIWHMEICDDVFETTFSNGVKIRVNYSKSAYTDSVGTVGAENYLIYQ